MEHFEKFESYIPVDLTDPRFFLLATAWIFAVVVFRYFLMAGLFWMVFYKWRPKSLQQRQIYKTLPNSTIQKFEMKWSLLTSVLFAFSGSFLGLMWQKGWTKIYLNISQYGWIYFFVSLFLISVVHEVYFYWTHRWLHRPSIYKRFHAVHHKSLTPSPWASFSFHPIEGLINALALPLIVLFIPVHPIALLIYLTLMTLSAVTNHMGFEILPASARQSIGKYFISGVHHTMHHKYYKYHFGLFYTFCDQIFKTEHPEFSNEFQNVFVKKSL